MFEIGKVLTAISRYNMLASGDRVAAAVSGGPDSVCLLHVLLELAPSFGVKVAAVAHVNHQLRGEASDEDERFVATLAARHRVAFLCERTPVAEAGGNLEQAARRARQTFFSRLIREGLVDRVATGHSLDDQAETVLFRLLRGSGLSGLAGILPVTREGLIRPLLDTTRAEVVDFLRTRGVSWREDSSNQDSRFARNRIRHDLLPQLTREWNPRVSVRLAHLADLAREEEQWWQADISRLAAEVLIPSQGGLEVDSARLVALPKAVARRLVRRACADIAPGFSPAFDPVERVLGLAAQSEGNGKVELSGVAVVRSFDWLRFSTSATVLRPEPVLVSVPGKYAWPSGSSQVCIEVRERDCRQGGCASLKLSNGRVPAPLELRRWNAGDHYRPAGYSRDQKIKDLFQVARVPLWRRRFWPIVSWGPKILWARGFGAAAEFSAEDEQGLALRIWEENT